MCGPTGKLFMPTQFLVRLSCTSESNNTAWTAPSTPAGGRLWAEHQLGGGAAGDEGRHAGLHVARGFVVPRKEPAGGEQGGQAGNSGMCEAAVQQGSWLVQVKRPTAALDSARSQLACRRTLGGHSARRLPNPALQFEPLAHDCRRRRWSWGTPMPWTCGRSASWPTSCWCVGL